MSRICDHEEDTKKKDKTASDIKIGSMTYDLKTKHGLIKKSDTFSKFSHQKGRIIVDDYDKICLDLSNDKYIFFPNRF